MLQSHKLFFTFQFYLYLLNIAVYYIDKIKKPFRFVRYNMYNILFGCHVNMFMLLRSLHVVVNHFCNIGLPRLLHKIRGQKWEEDQLQHKFET